MIGRSMPTMAQKIAPTLKMSKDQVKRIQKKTKLKKSKIEYVEHVWIDF